MRLHESLSRLGTSSRISETSLETDAVQNSSVSATTELKLTSHDQMDIFALL